MKGYLPFLLLAIGFLNLWSGRVLFDQTDMTVANAEASLLPDLSSQGASRAALEWNVSAECQPHSEAQVPSYMQVRFSFVSTRSGVDMDAFLSIGYGSEILGEETRWGLPSKEWVASRFEGPVASLRTYCDVPQDTRSLRISSYDSQDVQILLSRNESSSDLESLSRGTPRLLPLQPQGQYHNEFQAGGDTVNPYWLWFAIPVQSRSSTGTILQYDFQ